MGKKVKIVPIEQPFLKILAQYFLDQFREKSPDFSEILVIFPNERNKFYFRRYLLETAKTKAIIPPKMLTIEELTGYIYEKLGGERAKILHNIERNFILKKTTDELKIVLWQDLPFLRFISIGNRLLNFFDELSQERIKIEDIEEKSIELHFSERYVKNELPILKKVYQQYRENLAEAGYKDRIDEFETIYRDYDSKIFEEFDYIIIAGVAATTAFEKFIITRILSDSPAELILHSGTSAEISLSNEINKRYSLHYKLLDFLNIDITSIPTLTNEPIPFPVIHIKPLETVSKQTFYLGEIVSEAVEKYKEPHRIGIVLTDDSLLFPITEMLRSDNIEYNLSAGIPFSNQIFYSFLKQLYEAIKSNLHYSEFFVFLQHPLIKNAIIDNVQLRSLVYGLRDKMINEKKGYFRTEKQGEQLVFPGLEPGFAPLINFLEKCFATVQENLDFNAYIDNLIQLLNKILLYNQEIIKANFPGVNEFFDELHNLAQLRIQHNTVNPGIDMLEFILRILKDGKYHMEGKPLKGIQIIGVLEARNLDFDCIIIPSMNEGIFPRRSDKDMFINPTLRKEMGLITNQERDNLYYYYFTQLISGKKEVFLSYINEEKKDIPSRFIMMLESAGHTEDKKPVTLIRSAVKINEHSVKKDNKLIEILFKRIQKGLSHSLLKTYKACPYQFYLQYLLGIKEPDTILEEFDSKLWGSIFHDVARKFYKDHYASGFTRAQLDEVTKKFEEILKCYINSGEFLAIPPKPITYFNMLVYKIHIKRFLDKELERFQDGYRIFAESLEKKLKDTIEIGSYSIPLIGYVDRIDIKEGLYYIIDYKTGQLPDKKTYEISDEFVEFQLPLYALMFSKDGDKKIGGLIYYKIGKEPNPDKIYGQEDVMDYLNKFREKILIPTIDEMLDIDVPFYQAANRESCEYCSYNSLCGRIEYGGD